MTPEQVTIIAGIWGQLLPYAVDLINKHIESSKMRFLVSVVFCVLTGVFLNLDKLAFGDLGQVFETAGIVFSSSQIAYRMYYKDSTAQHKIRSQY